MNILGRITSRKILLIYTYEFLLQKNFEGDDDFDLQEHCSYLYEQFFCYKKQPPIDREYINQVGSALISLQTETFDAINKHVTTFGIEQMDKLDQAIFLLGYTEMKVLQTPRKILLNEMIELAKRYGDDGAPKLINGILHKIIEEYTHSNNDK